MKMIHMNVPGHPEATLEGYILDCELTLGQNRNRPAIVVCPGGGYLYCSPREAEPVALRYAARGFHAFILRYSVGWDAAGFSPLQEVSWVIGYLREHAEELHIDPNKIATCGFSAGGHLALAAGVKGENKPNAMILGYPVITSGEFAHRDSFTNLLGESAALELLEYVSLENRVTASAPPAFLWTTYTDEIVPMENTMLFASALRRAGVPFELHVYSVGEHGLGLAGKGTENHLGERVCPPCEGWVPLACAWLHRQCGQW